MEKALTAAAYAGGYLIRFACRLVGLRKYLIELFRTDKSVNGVVVAYSDDVELIAARSHAYLVILAYLPCDVGYRSDAVISLGVTKGVVYVFEPVHINDENNCPVGGLGSPHQLVKLGSHSTAVVKTRHSVSLGEFLQPRTNSYHFKGGIDISQPVSVNIADDMLLRHTAFKGAVAESFGDVVNGGEISHGGFIAAFPELGEHKLRFKNAPAVIS